MSAPKVTLIDNYDSFTFNLAHYLGELGAKVSVWRNDVRAAEDFVAEKPDAIVVSPGPCTPREAGVCLALIRLACDTIPIFGVCLGHQAIGDVFGGQVVRAPKPVHGKVAPIRHDDSGVFAGLPNPLLATRYHSLIVDRASLPDCLAINARSEDGLIMGMRHRTRPTHGVQFHPESIASQHGHALLGNFLDLARRWNENLNRAA